MNARFVVPAAAAPEQWLALQVALAASGPPPCAERPDAWFALPTSDAAAAARRGCLACPVRAECGAYAVAARERDGIWAGLSWAERRAPERRAS